MKKQLNITKDYLLLPIKTGAAVQTVSVYCGEEKIYEYEVPVKETEGTYEYDFQAAFPVRTWKDRQLTVEGQVPESFLEAIALSDQLPTAGCRKPMIHFAPNSGWLNDPNGLLYHNGLYHLYFQHNPVNIEWGNMTWGHAVSKDLIHWEQGEDVLFPDEDGTMFSGCAMLNERGLLGIPKDAELYFYTCAGSSSKWSKGKKFVQKVAWSTDNGKTLNKLDGCILDHIIADNRDPEVYWHEGRQLYYMVMYFEKDQYAIFNSTDLQNWELTQKLSLPDAWECPDLMEVPVEGGGTKWVFWTADGYYFVGDFDGSHFTSDEIRKEAYHSMLPYAAQSYFGTERAIMIPWMRTNSLGKTYRGMMGIPRQLTLVEKDGSLVLRQKLVDEFEQSKKEVLAVHLDGGNADDSSVSYTQAEDAAVEVVICPENGTGFGLDLYGTHISLEDGDLKITGVAPRSSGVEDAVKLGEKECVTGEAQEGRILKLNGCPEKISIISDGEILEITVDDGIMAEAFETSADDKKGVISVKTESAAEVKIFRIQ